MARRPKGIWLFALALPLLFTAACPPPWVIRERHQERHERRERYDDRDERRERRDDREERRERRDDREERRERWD